MSFSKITLETYRNKPVVYMGKIGSIQSYFPYIVQTNREIHIDEKQPIYKYGVTNNIKRRIYNEHMKKFSDFQLHYFRESQNNKQIEAYITKELRLRKLLLKLEWDGRIQRELFYLGDSEKQKDWFENFVDDIIKAQTFRIK